MKCNLHIVFSYKVLVWFSFYIPVELKSLKTFLGLLAHSVMCRSLCPHGLTVKLEFIE